MSKLNGKVAVVTGASKGIGAAIAKALAVQGDVAKAADVKRIFAETKQAHGKVDVLVNNAGVYAFAPLEAITEEEFHREYNTNVLGLLLATQEAEKHFPAEGGSVINISSAVTTITVPYSALYSGTKGAVDAITRVLAKDLGPKKIRVNAINPGVIETEGTQTAGVIGTDFEKQVAAQTPLGRIGQPSEIAAIAVFLASNDSGWMTGDTLLASGGMR